MANEKNNRGGTHEQHVKAGEQSHKNTSGSSREEGRDGSRGENESGSGSSRGASEGNQQGKAGDQSRKGESGGSTQGGSHEQHVKAGEQSHKNR
jgi:hypothetical protein